MIENIQKIDNNWFSKFYNNQNGIVDLTNIDFISFSDLVNLFLAIEYKQKDYEYTILNFYGLGPLNDNIYLMPIDEYNNKRKEEWKWNDSANYQKAKITYNFLSYLKHFGFFDSLIRLRSIGKVTLSGISQELLDKLYAFSGIGTKIITLTPIFDKTQASELRVERAIDTWLNYLPNKIKMHPIFRDDEFSRVLGFQLVNNILEHSGIKATQNTAALGAFSMQLIEKDKFKIFKNSFSPIYNKLFNEENDGILEICVGDNGIGIYSTLKDKYLDIHRRVGTDKSKLDENELIKNVICFAFDEIGSSKKGNRRIGGVHALHRILRITAKYSGILKIRSNGFEFIYNLALFDLIKGNDGFGFIANEINNVPQPVGVQFQILIPIRISSELTKTPVKRYIFNNSKELKSNIIPLTVYFEKDKEYSYNDIIENENFIENVSLHEVPNDTIIIYDFADRNWSEEEISNILLSQKSVLHNKFCIGVNFPKGLNVSLREREKRKISDEKKVLSKDTDFFDVLSSEHRLFPTFDNNGLLIWLGLSDYEFDELFLMSYDTPPNNIINDSKIFDGKIFDEKIEICKIYLKNNPHFFRNTIKNNEWECIITPDFFRNIEKTLISHNLPTIFKELGCICNDGNQRWILPTTDIITDNFIKFAPILQDEVTVSQLGKWLANSILDKLMIDEDKLLIITVNGPSALLAKSIENELKNKEVFLLSFNLYSENTELIETINNYLNIPVFIVYDIYDDKWNSIDIKELLIKNNINIRGILSLLKFRKDLIEEFNVIYKWKEIIFKDKVKNNEIIIPHFIVSEYKKPKKYDWKDLTENEKEDLKLVDFFSTKDFKLKDLIISDKDNLNKLQLLENYNILREGHWVYEQHHFCVTTSLRNMFKNEYISGQINQDILNIIRDYKINTLIIPFHSHIKDFINELLVNIKMHLGFSIDYYYCIYANGLTTAPFYILPEKLNNELRNTEKEYRILILDDAIATARTQESLLRAIILPINRNKKSKLQSINIYCIINRMGRARTTIYQSIKNIAVENNRLIEFNFKQWILLDMSVFQSDNCPICQEENRISFLTESLGKGDPSVLNEINIILESKVAMSTESPNFVDYKLKKLFLNDEDALSIGNCNVKTVELALWQIYNLLYRGYPLRYLIDDFNKFSSDLNYDTFNIEHLKIEFCGIMIRNWDRIHLQSTENYFKEYLIKELKSGDRTTKHILYILGEKLPFLKSEKSKIIIYEIICEAIDALGTFNHEDDSKNRENLRIGISFCLLLYSQGILNLSKTKRKVETDRLIRLQQRIESLSKNGEFSIFVKLCYQNINFNIQKSILSDGFIPSLMFVLEHTIRPSRPGHSHNHLLPSLLDLLKKNEVIINNEDRKECVNTISNFLVSLNYLENHYPQFFDVSILSNVTNLKDKMEYLLDCFRQDNWIDDKPSKLLNKAARKTFEFFPSQKSTTLHIYLAKSQLDILSIIEFVNEECNINHIIFENLIDQCENGKKTLIIPPTDENFSQIKEIIHNYLDIKDYGIEDRKVRVLYEKDEDDRKRIFIILTKLSSEKDAKYFLNNSHALNSFNTSIYNAFGCKAHVKAINIEGFTCEIRISFYKGYKLN